MNNFTPKLHVPLIGAQNNDAKVAYVNFFLNLVPVVASQMLNPMRDSAMTNEPSAKDICNRAQAIADEAFGRIGVRMGE